MPLQAHPQFRNCDLLLCSIEGFGKRVMLGASWLRQTCTQGVKNRQHFAHRSNLCTPRHSVTYLDLNIYCLSAGSTKRLVNHDACIRHAVSLSNLSSSEEECAHGGSKTEAVCLNICLAQVDSIIDSHACSHRATCASNGE